MNIPEEFGDVFIQVVPTLDGALETLAKGGAKGAETYAKTFGDSIKGSQELKDAFTTAGDATSEAFTATFDDATKRDLGKLDVTSPLKGVFTKAGEKASKDFTTEFGTRSGTAMSSLGGDLAGKLGDVFGSKLTDAVSKWIPQFGGVTDAVHDIAGAFDKANPLLEAFGLDLGSLSGLLDGATSKAGGFSDAVGGAGDNLGSAVDRAEKMIEKVPFLKGAFGDIATGALAAAGELGFLATAFVFIGEQIDKLQGKLHDQAGFLHAAKEGEKGGSDWGWDWWHPWDIPGKSRYFQGWWPFKHDMPKHHNFYQDQDWYGHPPLPPPTTQPATQMHIPVTGPNSPGPDRSSPFENLPDYKPPPEPKAPKAPKEPKQHKESTGGGGRPRVNTSIGGVSDRRGLAAAGSRVANLFAFAESLEGTPYSTDLRNDCSGMVSQLAAVALGLPPPEAALRFTTMGEAQWLYSHGFEPGVGGPNDLTIGWNPLPGQSGHTAATLPGGVHAESGAGHGFLLGPGAAGGEDPQFSQHAHLSMGRGGKSGPSGSAEDPVYTTSAPNSDGSDASSQGEQLGQGLVRGLLQELGLPDVFGKPPTQWGSVKLGMGALNWGASMLQPFLGGGASGGSDDTASPFGSGGSGLGGALSGALSGLAGMASGGMGGGVDGEPHLGTGAPPGPPPMAPYAEPAPGLTAPALTPPALSAPTPAARPPGLTPPALTPPAARPDPLAGITDPALRGIAQGWLDTHGSLPTLPQYKVPPGTPPLRRPQRTGGLTGLVPVPGFAHGGILPGDSPGFDNLIGILPSGKAIGLQGGEGVINPKAMRVPGVPLLVNRLNTHLANGGQVDATINTPGGGSAPDQAQGAARLGQSPPLFAALGAVLGAIASDAAQAFAAANRLYPGMRDPTTIDATSRQADKEAHQWHQQLRKQQQQRRDEDEQFQDSLTYQRNQSIEQTAMPRPPQDVTGSMRTTRPPEPPAQQHTAPGPTVNYNIQNQGLITPEASRTITENQTRTSVYRPVMHV